MKFFVGMARFRLDCSMCASLKDKRRVVKSVLDRLGNSRVMCAAEVGDNDLWKSAVIGVACVSSSKSLVDGSLDAARRMIEGAGVEVIGEERWAIKPEDL